MNVEPGRLKKGTVPMVCASSGQPTTLVRHHFLWRMHKVVWWSWLLWGPIPVLFYKVVTGDGVHVVLPISNEVRLKTRLVLLARTVAVTAVVSTWLSASGTVMSLARTGVVFGGIAGCVVLFRYTRRYWVAPRWNGATVRLLDPHPDFAAAVRGVTEPERVMPQVPAFALEQVPSYDLAPDARPQFAEPEPDPAPVVAAPVSTVPAPVSSGPAPGWYADPAGQHAARWYDGQRWTEQVA